jgi:hypothetical protein
MAAVTPLQAAPSASRLRRPPVGRAVAATAAITVTAALLVGHRHAAAVIAACALAAAAAAVIAFVHILATSSAQRPATLPNSTGIWESDEEADEFFRDTYAARSIAGPSGLTLAAYQAGARTTASYPEQDLLAGICAR